MMQQIVGQLKKLFSLLTRRSGWVLLLIAFILGCLSIYWGSFVDEGDNFATSLLLSHGKVLYRDVFSHHFPFPYYYATVVTMIFGTSIFWLRFSVWAFLIVSFALSMKLSGYHQSLGLALFIWSLVRHFYRGNMFLYNSFSAAGLVVVFALTLFILLENHRPNWKYIGVFGIFGLVSIFSDPLSIYAFGVAILFIALKNFRASVYIVGVVVVGVFIFLMYLSLTASVMDFFQNAITFNSNVYGQYLDTNPQKFEKLVLYAVRGLEITDRLWQNPNPMKQLDYNVLGFDQWLFTGFLYRLAFTTTAVFLLIKKKFSGAAFVYLFAASLLVISPGNFRGQPFILVAFVVISSLICKEWTFQALPFPVKNFHWLASVIITLMVLWLCFRLISFSIEHRKDFLPAQSFAFWAEEARQIESLACGQKNVYLINYPGGTYSYWFTGFAPASKFLFMWPWVADVGLEQAIQEIQTHSLVIILKSDSIIWSTYDTKEYLQPLSQMLKEKYIQVNSYTFVSTKLAALCNLSPQSP